MEKNSISIDDFFKSEEHKLIFALLYTDTKLRADLLGLSEDLYLDKAKAKEWRNTVQKKIHPDICKITGADEAVKKINELYARMTEVDDEEGEVDE